MGYRIGAPRPAKVSSGDCVPSTSKTSSVFGLALYARPVRPDKVSGVPERVPVTQAASLTAAGSKIVVQPLSHQYPQVDVPQPLPTLGYPQGSVSKPDLYLPPELHMALRAS